MDNAGRGTVSNKTEMEQELIGPCPAASPGNNFPFNPLSLSLSLPSSQVSMFAQGLMAGTNLNFLHTHLGIRLQIAHWIHTAHGELFALFSQSCKEKGGLATLALNFSKLFWTCLVGGTPLYLGTWCR